MELLAIAIGGCIGFFTGDPLRLLEDAQFLKPHFFPSVPRVLNRVYQSAMAAGNAPGLKGALFRMAVKTKLDQLHATGINSHALWDFLVFNKVCHVLGVPNCADTILDEGPSRPRRQSRASEHGFCPDQRGGDRLPEDRILL